MDQGFWLFFIFQLVALGLLAEKMNLVGLRRLALLAGIGGSLIASLMVLVLNYGGVAGETARTTLKWLMLAAMMASLVATAASVAIPPEMSRKRA
jgi:hypothetical protein